MSEHQVNNNNGRYNIVEDGPVMRSVAMMSHHPLSRIQDSSGKVGFTEMETHSPSELALNSDHMKFSVDIASQTQSQPSGAAIWNVTHLNSIPINYRLERTHVCVPDVTLHTVTTRISDAIRNESIAAVYDDDQAKVSAETKCGVRFSLHLWSSKGCIIAECQREAGCGFTYCLTVKKILKAAKNGCNTVSGLGSSSKRRVQKGVSLKSFSVPQCIRDNSSCQSSLRIPSEDLKSTVSDSLSISKDMLLGDDRMDVKLLAIESLCQLSQSSDPECRIVVARSLLATADLFHTILSLIIYSQLDSKNSYLENDITTSIEQEHYNLMRRKALTVLSNCFHTLDEHGELDATRITKCVEASQLETLLKTLVRIVSMATTANPHEACDACMCLQLLCSRCMNIKRKVTEELNGSIYTERAQKLCRHVALENEAEKLLVELRS